MTTDATKPNIAWMEGLLTLFETEPPLDNGDPRRKGFAIGRQIIGLYIIEILLKYALDETGGSYGPHHNLHELFRNLPRQRRRAVDRKYGELLNSQFEWAWDVAESAESLLGYLGKNPITGTRYFWEDYHSHGVGDASLLFAPAMLGPMIYALLIVLHNYPSGPIVKRHDTAFYSLEESLDKEQ